MLGNLHLRLTEDFLEMTDTERPLREQMQDAQPRPVAETFVDPNEIHRSATGAGRVRRFAASAPAFINAAAFLGQTIGVTRFQLEIDAATGHFGARDRILRRDAAIVFHFHLQIVAGQHGFAEVEDFGERCGVQPMVRVRIGDPGLEQTSLARVVHRPAAIDEAFRDVTDLRDVEMLRDRFPVWQDEARLRIRVAAEESFELAELHGRINIP